MKSRRDFFRLSALLAGAAVTPQFLQQAAAAPVPADALPAPDAPRAALRIRRNVNSLTIDDPILVSYRKAVKAMMALPESDPRNWTRQARIHETHCSHNNWFFLPWHRAYLLAFEDICRELSGDDAFTLPYWNWTAYPQVPAAFWEEGSVLYNRTRIIGRQDTALDEMIGTRAVNAITRNPDFLAFGGRKSPDHHTPAAAGGLERTPHNYIHRFIGGNMATMMSPLDPVFWLHHANVDRIWGQWNDDGNPNPSDQDYLGYEFSRQFSDPKGDPRTIRLKDMLDHRKLGYRYDSQEDRGQQANFAFRFPEFTLLDAGDRPFRLTARMPKAVRFALSADASRLLNNAVLASHTSEVPQETVQLVINDVQPPANDNFLVRVFVNCPYLSPDTPINDPHYVTTFTFFGSAHHLQAHDHHGGGHDGAGIRYVFDITATLKKIQASLQKDNLERNLEVKLLSIPLADGEPAILQTGKVEVVLAKRDA